MTMNKKPTEMQNHKNMVWRAFNTAHEWTDLKRVMKFRHDII